jgi:thiamine biosynthesis protein ThiS
VNGEPMQIAGPRTLATLLAELNIDPRRVAVEHNLTIVKRANHDSVLVQEGDEIEIVNFVGGGAQGSRCRPANGRTLEWMPPEPKAPENT